jgi:hypothetical protein
MKRTEVLNGMRMLKFRDVFGCWEKGRLSELEATETSTRSLRTFSPMLNGGQKCFRADGGKLFILPSLVVGTPYEHIHRPGTGRATVRVSRNISQNVRARWKSVSMQAQPAPSASGG